MLALRMNATIKPRIPPVRRNGRNFGERRMVTCSVFKVVFAIPLLNTI
jgi:hypothetical protein